MWIKEDENEGLVLAIGILVYGSTANIEGRLFICSLLYEKTMKYGENIMNITGT